MTVANKNRKVEIYASTGTGSSQTIKHFLGVTPTFVKITPTETGVTEACWLTATKTAITVTVTNEKDFKVQIEA